jgi:hypothetical protein
MSKSIHVPEHKRLRELVATRRKAGLRQQGRGGHRRLPQRAGPPINTCRIVHADCASYIRNLN